MVNGLSQQLSLSRGGGRAGGHLSPTLLAPTALQTVTGELLGEQAKSRDKGKQLTAVLCPFPITSCEVKKIYFS